MGKQYKEEDALKDRLTAFSSKEDAELQEGTSTYHKFREPGERLDGLFKGIDSRNLSGGDDDKLTECVIIQDASGENHLLAQTIVVKELKKKWDEVKEIGFPVRIIYKGTVGDGAEKYQSFRLLFE